MGDDTGIGWCDATWNPIVGCSIHTPGCTNCYAMKMAHRLAAISVAHERDHGGDPGPFAHYRGITLDTKAGPVWTGKVNEAPHAIWTKPSAWKRPRRIFVNSMSDIWHPDVPDATIDRMFAAMAQAPQHTYQLLTKRAERMYAYMNDPQTPIRIIQWLAEDEPLMWPLPQVWLGVSVEDQPRADDRLPYLIASPARIHWVSFEPLLGPVMPFTDDILAKSTALMPTRGDEAAGIDWMVIGGESGPGARPPHSEWIRALITLGQWAGAAVNFKQWGDWAPPEQFEVGKMKGSTHDYVRNGDTREYVLRPGKHLAGRTFDGVIYDSFPA